MKSQKRAVPNRKGSIIGYEAQNIYKIFIKKTGKIEKLRDVKIIEDNQSLAIYLADKGPFYYLDFTLKEENKLLPIKVNNLSNSDNTLSLIYSDIETPLCHSTRTWNIPDKYDTIAQYVKMTI